jgi:hypothetical protein
MGINMLTDYLSRGQVREYLGYILENGLDDIFESPDSVHASDPLPIRIGSSLNSIKVFHVARHMDEKYWLTQEGITLSSDDTKPELPEYASVVGVVYMSKFDRDYTGDPDNFAGNSIQGDIGCVTWFDAEAWDSAILGKSINGINHRLFIFWRSDLITGPIEKI